MAFASFVADAAIAVVQTAADEIGGPLAPALRRNAATLVYNIGQLGIDMDAAIGVLTDIERSLRAWHSTRFRPIRRWSAATLNRNQERSNQAALDRFRAGPVHRAVRRAGWH